MNRPIEQLDDPTTLELAADYAGGASGMAWNDPEKVSAYYAFLAGWNAYRAHLSLSGDSQCFTKIDELERFMVFIDSINSGSPSEVNERE